MEQPIGANVIGYTLADAIAFLEERCGCLVVQVEIVPPLWKVVSLDGEFEAVLSDTELVSYACTERNRRVHWRGPLGLDTLEQLPAPASHSSARPTYQTTLSEWPAPLMDLRDKEVRG